MALGPGTRLGPYEIGAQIGAGGMGAVYRARDTRLGRTVAIKVLLPSIAAHPEVRARFEREARAISALDHPHICTLYDIGEDAGVSYLVMQHLEGETLAARLAKGNGKPLPLTTVLEVGRAIGDALDKAHRVGITHRDLKPANIMLTKAGATLLDFGVAKLRPASVASLEDLTRQASPDTERGMIVGTVQYMAPEQIEAGIADARSDIFSFGAVLYEMATGHRAFPGDSTASVIGAVLKDHPKPISSSQPLAPRALNDIVMRCLAKDPEDRWQSARDIVLELKRVAEDPAPNAAVASGRPAARSWIPWAAAGVALVALIAVLWTSWTGPEPRTAADPVHFTIVPPNDGTIHTAAVSPNGRRIVLAVDSGGRTQLWIRSLHDVELRPLAGTDEVAYHFWSPDSNAVGFFAHGKLKTIDIETGTINVVCNATNARGGAWGADRTIVFAAGTGQGLSRVSADGGTPQPLTALEPSRRESSHRWPVFLPGGRHFIYFARSGDPENTGIYLSSVDSSAPRRLVSAVSNAAYAPPGVLLFLRGSALIAHPFDVDKLTLHGEPSPIVDGVSYDPTVWLADFSVSQTNVLLFISGNRNQSQLVWHDRRGTELASLGAAAAYANVSLSRDDERVAVAQYAAGASDIWLLDARSGNQSRLTFAAANEMHPVWSPDANRIVFGSDREGSLNLYMKPATGGREELLLSSAAAKYGSDWSADGGYVVYDAVDPRTKLDVWVLPLKADRTPAPFLNSTFDEWQGTFSPDGRWMAYTSNESGRYEVYVKGFPTSGDTWQVSTRGGMHPRWRQDQKELYYINGDQKLVAVPIRTGGTFEQGAHTVLFGTRIHRTFAVRSPYAVSRDGQRFLMTRLPNKPAPVTVIADWSSGLKQ